MIRIISLALVLLVTLPGCSWLRSESRETAKNVVDCTTASVRSLNRQFGPVVEEVIVQATRDDGSVDWDRIKHATAGFAVDTGMCVLADVVARALAPVQRLVNAPNASPLEADPAQLRAGFAELAGGRRFKTEAGEL